MKTVASIDPEKEYANAKSIIDEAGSILFNEPSLQSLSSSVDKLIQTTRILLEREDKKRGKKPPKKIVKKKKKGEENKPREKFKKLPSERYPHLPIHEDVIYPSKAPKCPCCSSLMKESGLYDVTEKLEVIPKKYYIQRNKRPKFNCGSCYSSLVNTPALPSISNYSNYGDSLMIDVTLSKFCDLIPMERYVAMASRMGLENLPAHSLIELTHHLGSFLSPVYELIKLEAGQSKVLLADETTHKMLEGSKTPNWYLWGFFNENACYYEAHDTRSGDVAFDFIKDSHAEYLLTDGYTGYNKALKKVKSQLDRKIIPAHCNAHAVRYFKEASITWGNECSPFLKIYGSIYKLKNRQKMVPLFEQLRDLCKSQVDKAMSGSSFKKAMNYFLNHYEGLTVCTKNDEVPLDNNYSERQIRPLVVGRKTWYGTHSVKGAMTTSIHFSIIGSCRVNSINPRNYYPWVVERVLQGKDPLTPYEYSRETR